MARTETYDEVRARIDADYDFTDRDIIGYKLRENEFEYPIYKKRKQTGLVVKFTGPRTGEVVDAGSTAWSQHHCSDSWVKHTDEYWEDWTPPSVDEFRKFFERNPWRPQTASDFLAHAKSIQDERGKNYDRKDGERSMGATITAFNAITKRDLSESEGWLLMVLLKHVRQWSAGAFHEDSAVDAVSYEALLAECLKREFGE